MSHRTYGSTRDCKGCRFWSEMIAGCNGTSSVQALCLAPKPAPCHGKYMTGSATCPAWASGHLGAVDEPGEPPDYSAEDEPAEESYMLARRD